MKNKEWTAKESMIYLVNEDKLMYYKDVPIDKKIEIEKNWMDKTMAVLGYERVNKDKNE